MILLLKTILCFQAAVYGCSAFQLPPKNNELQRLRLHKLADSIEDVFVEEYTHFEESGEESDTLKEITEMLTPSINVRYQEIDDLCQERQGKSCILCRVVARLLLEQRRAGKNEQEIETTGYNLCRNFKVQKPNVCLGLIQLMLPHILYIIDNRPDLTAQKLCGVVFQGSNCVYEDAELMWSLEGVAVENSATQSKTTTVQPSKDDLIVVQMTDFHYDYNYKVGANADCSEPTCCRESQGLGASPQTSAADWGDYRNCDVPFQVIDSLFDQVLKEHKHIDYIYFTGDIVDHGVWETKSVTNIKSINLINNFMQEVFEDIPVFPILGNHEAHPVNLYTPSNLSLTRPDLSIQWLYDLAAVSWEKWLPEDALKTVRLGGYYTVLAKPGLRVIALNNNDCYTYDFWILHTPEMSKPQLKWLYETLVAAKGNDEKVHILAHIPPGEGSCFKTWAREYRKIVEIFADIISAQFFGHTHKDEFNLFYDQLTSDYAVNVGWNGGSLTPYDVVNPNYRVYSIAPTTYEVNDIDTWIYNITDANLMGGPKWERLYSFREAYDLPDLSPSSLNELVLSMAVERNILKSYWERKVKMADSALEKGCDDECLVNHLCEIVTVEHGDLRKCRMLTKAFKYSW